MKKTQLKRRGFTLIEIMIVVVIIGILAGFGVAKYGQYTRDSRRTGCVRNQNNIDRGVSMWESRNSSFPATTKSGYSVIANFNQLGHVIGLTGSNPPGRFPSPTKNSADIAQILDSEGDLFVCPEAVNLAGNITKLPDKENDCDYSWRYLHEVSPHLNGKTRGTVCLLFGSDGSGGRPDGNPGTGPGGSKNIEDLHSGGGH